jgi:hypothetical protein
MGSEVENSPGVPLQFIATFLPPYVADVDWLVPSLGPPPDARMLQTPIDGRADYNFLGANLEIILLAYLDAAGTVPPANIRTNLMSATIELLQQVRDEQDNLYVAHANHAAIIFPGFEGPALGIDLGRGGADGLRLIPRIVGWAAIDPLYLRVDMFARFRSGRKSGAQ